MFYFHIVTILYGLSLTEAFKIKVSAQVHVSKQASKFFRDTLAKLGKGGTPEDIGNKPRKCPRDVVGHQYINYISQLKKEATVIEARPTKHNGEQDEEDCKDTVITKMMQNEQHDVHLYGNHVVKHGRTDGPVNNINL